jgi:hypothetical protein
MFDLNLHDIPTPQLWERIQTLNERTLRAPPHLRSQLYDLYLQLSQEYTQRTDK